MLHCSGFGLFLDVFGCNTATRICYFHLVCHVGMAYSQGLIQSSLLWLVCWFKEQIQVRGSTTSMPYAEWCRIVQNLGNQCIVGRAWATVEHFELKQDTRIRITKALLRDVQYKTTFRPATPLGGARSCSSQSEMLVLVLQYVFCSLRKYDQVPGMVSDKLFHLWVQ